MTDADLNQGPPQEPMQPDTPTVSQMLIEAREAKGLSQKEVADQLYLSATFIRYIDEGQFGKLPKQAFIKGYLRSYARVVGLDGNAVVAAFERDQDSAPAAAPAALGSVTEEVVGSGAFTGPVVQTGIVGLVVIVVVVTMVWWFSSGKSSPPVAAQSDRVAHEVQPASPPAGTAGEQVEPANTVAAQAASPGATAGQESPAMSGSSSPASATGTSPNAPQDAAAAPADTTADTSGDAASADTASEQQAELDQPPIPIASDVKIDRVRSGDAQQITVKAGTGNDEMQFEFSGACWVEITDGRGEKIYGDLNRAGDVMTVYGVAPFEVLLGKAPVVTMTWQGKTINLAPYTTKDQTAKIRTARL